MKLFPFEYSPAVSRNRNLPTRDGPEECRDIRPTVNRRAIVSKREEELGRQGPFFKSSA